LRALITQPEEDDDEEHFDDAPDSDDEASTKPKAKIVPAANNNIYDGRKRDPRFANADKTCLWELVSFTLLSNYTSSWLRTSFPMY
jgi:ribosome biogenesis protein MAK21